MTGAQLLQLDASKEAPGGGAPEAIDPWRSFKRAALMRQWREALQLYDAVVQSGVTPDPQAYLLHALANIDLAPDDEQERLIQGIDPAWIVQDEDIGTLKRLLIGPLVRKGRFGEAAIAQRLLASVSAQTIEEHLILARYLGRTGDWSAATDLLRAEAEKAPPGPDLLAQLITTLLQANLNEEAASWASLEASWDPAHPALSHAALLALLRTGETVLTLRLADRIDPLAGDDLRLSATLLEAYNACAQPQRVLAIGEKLVAAGKDSAPIRLALARAYLQAVGIREPGAKASHHVTAAMAMAPANLRSCLLLGEALLRSGQFAAAVEALAQAHALAPDNHQARALLARALRHTGRYAEASEHFQWLTHKNGPQAPWGRFAAGALQQAGQPEAARQLYAQFIHRRRSDLPDDLAQGLKALHSDCQTARIPQARLDWAWQFADREKYPDRAAWEHLAKWGHLADHLLLEWLECNNERIDEAMVLLADLSETERQLHSVDVSRGLVLATAHIGPLYAGPMILELLGMPAKWLASTPNLLPTTYSGSLISTSDQTDTQVTKAMLSALDKAHLVSLAVDGAGNPNAPRIGFQGQDLTYSNFASRIAHRTGVPSMFYALGWQDGLISIDLRQMPSVNPGEDINSYALRWRQSFLDHMLDHLRGPPENLRLAGGLWRHIRA